MQHLTRLRPALAYVGCALLALACSALSYADCGLNSPSGKIKHVV